MPSVSRLSRIWEPGHLTTQWVSMACYRVSFTFFMYWEHFLRATFHDFWAQNNKFLLVGIVHTWNTFKALKSNLFEDDSMRHHVDTITQLNKHESAILIEVGVTAINKYFLVHTKAEYLASHPRRQGSFAWILNLKRPSKLSCFSLMWAECHLILFNNGDRIFVLGIVWKVRPLITISKN
jgi:hypothetical protein